MQITMITKFFFSKTQFVCYLKILNYFLTSPCKSKNIFLKILSIIFMLKLKKMLIFYNKTTRRKILLHFN